MYAAIVVGMNQFLSYTYLYNIQLDMTPLHYGAENSHTLEVEALIKAKADVNTVDIVS